MNESTHMIEARPTDPYDGLAVNQVRLMGPVDPWRVVRRFTRGGVPAVEIASMRGVGQMAVEQGSLAWRQLVEAPLVDILHPAPEPAEPAHQRCPRGCRVDVRDHLSTDLVDGQCDTAPAAIGRVVRVVSELERVSVGLFNDLHNLHQRYRAGLVDRQQLVDELAERLAAYVPARTAIIDRAGAARVAMVCDNPWHATGQYRALQPCPECWTGAERA